MLFAPALVMVSLAADGGTVEAELEKRLAADPVALELAKKLYAKGENVVTTLPEQDFEGGYRGVIHLVPVLPVGAERRHLEYVAAALGTYDAFFGGLEAEAKVAPHYRWSGLTLRFFKSVKRKTPAAFAQGWTVSYNMNGTLNGSERQVRDLLFHEIFHLNDADHSDWTERALAWTHKAIKAKCGSKTECLSPYAPDPLIVRGGTYYSFHADNGPGEYGADLATRYFREQREVIAGRAVAKPFKCGPPENARVWAALVDEFFAGVDRVPACAAPK